MLFKFWLDRWIEKDTSYKGFTSLSTLETYKACSSVYQEA